MLAAVRNRHLFRRAILSTIPINWNGSCCAMPADTAADPVARPISQLPAVMAVLISAPLPISVQFSFAAGAGFKPAFTLGQHRGLGFSEETDIHRGRRRSPGTKRQGTRPSTGQGKTPGNQSVRHGVSPYADSNLASGPMHGPSFQQQK